MTKKRKDRFDLKSSRLLRAVEEGNMPSARAALDSGEPVDIRDLDGNTPLIRAAFLGNLDLIQVFLERGADVNASNDIGWTALHFTAQEDRHAAAKALLSVSGVKIDAVDAHGNTPLWRAVFSDSRETMKVLIRGGADTKRKNKHGVSPAGLAESTDVELPKS